MGARRRGGPKAWGPRGVGARTQKKWSPKGEGRRVGAEPRKTVGKKGGGPNPDRRPGLVGPPGFHTTAREPKRAHLSVPAFKNTTKIQREDLPEREERNFRWERKKERNFGWSRGRAVRWMGVRVRGPKILNTPTTHINNNNNNNNNNNQAPTGTNKHQQEATTTENLAKTLKHPNWPNAVNTLKH